LPNRPSLGRFVRHLAQIDAAVGAADHLVSRSICRTPTIWESRSTRIVRAAHGVASAVN
jgi:hypothetical protein